VFTGARNTLPVFTARGNFPCTRAVKRCLPLSTARIHGHCIRVVEIRLINGYVMSLIALANLNGLVFVKDCDESVDFAIKYLGKLCSIELNR